MPPVSVPITGEALARALRGEFRRTWQLRHKSIMSEMQNFAELALNSDKISEIYGYGEPPPYPKRRPWGDEVRTKGFRFRNFEVENLAWDSAVEWYRHQRLFDQLKDLPRLARQGGDQFATLPDRVIVGQMIPNAADPDLLETIPNAPDGVETYSALDGDGEDRFGTPGGNVIAAGLAGVGSGDAIRQDSFNLLEQIGGFLDPEGEPAHDAGILKKFSVLFPLGLWEVMLEAFVQKRTEDNNAAVTNVMQDNGMSITLIPTPRLSGDDYYIFLDDFEPKPFFEQVALALEEEIQVQGNSDIARRTKREGIFWETIRGYGRNLPLGTGKVDNA